MSGKYCFTDVFSVELLEKLGGWKGLIPGLCMLCLCFTPPIAVGILFCCLLGFFITEILSALSRSLSTTVECRVSSPPLVSQHEVLVMPFVTELPLV